jgi:hypothetical protein
MLVDKRLAPQPCSCVPFSKCFKSTTDHPQTTMRSAIRISAANVQRPGQIAPRSGFVCLQCRQRVSATGHWPHPSTITTYTAKRNASSDFTEGLRKRIWGTSEPPGQEDPYGEKSALDRIKEAAEASSGEVISDTKAKLLMPRDRDLGSDYVPATSIADLALLPPSHQMPPFQWSVLLTIYYSTYTEC